MLSKGNQMIDTKLRNKVALITGANNPYGIGASIAKALSEQGVKVFLQYYRSDKSTNSSKTVLSEEFNGDFYLEQQTINCEKVLASIKETGGEGFAFEYDLNNLSDIPTIFNEAEKIFGRVDILNL
jgi:3-oxoacyl-[acyl-carrier protein] reductase